MSVLAALDATRICVRAPADPSAWAMPAPEPTRSHAAAPAGSYSWWSLVRNPRAVLVSGLVGAAAARDAAVRALHP